MAREPGWRDPAAYAATAFVVTALAPRLARLARWPTRLGRRGLLAYITCNTLIGFALRTWAVPYFKRLAAAPKDEGLHGI